MVDPDLWHPCWQDSERHALFVTGKDMKNWNDDIPQQLRWIATRRFPPVLQNLEARHRNWSISFSDISLHLEIYRELEGGGAAAGTSCFHLQILHWLSWDIYKKRSYDLQAQNVWDAFHQRWWRTFLKRRLCQMDGVQLQMYSSFRVERLFISRRWTRLNAGLITEVTRPKIRLKYGV